jgi:hypothetical protein
VAEPEAALERKADATTEAPMEEGRVAECQRRVICRRARIVTTAAPDYRERAALRKGQLTRNQLEARQKHRGDSTRDTEGDRVRLYRPARKGKVPNIARVYNAAHQVQCHIRAKMIVAHMNRLAPYLGTARDEQP